jgi:hypothetical protein
MCLLFTWRLVRTWGCQTVGAFRPPLVLFANRFPRFAVLHQLQIRSPRSESFKHFCDATRLDECPNAALAEHSQQAAKTLLFTFGK